jgi:hypothetical protein
LLHISLRLTPSSPSRFPSNVTISVSSFSNYPVMANFRCQLD